MLITRLWRQQPGKYFCISTKTASGSWEDHFFTRSEFKKVPRFIDDHRGRDLYFCPHGFSHPKRLKEHAELPNLLWSDMDEANPRDVSPRPTIAIESSPGRYVGLWLLDKPMTESLNRRLAYSLDADKSGWDLTQVLRWPGTINYKYSSHPRTRIMWADGDSWTVRAIDKMLPAEAESQSLEETDAAAIFKKWMKKIPPWCQRELATRKYPEPGKRSEMIWKIGNALLEAGLPKDEALCLIAASVWNKFKGRRNEVEQLNREWDKVINHHFKASKSEVAGETDDEGAPQRFAWRNMAEVEEENMEWVWYPYLARGQVSILEGDPEAGKSYLTQMIAARISCGETLPTVDSTVPAVKGTVVYFDLENTAGTVTKKRLRWNGYDDDKLTGFYQQETPFSIDDEEALEQVYDGLEMLKPALIVFDTLNTYIGKADTSQGAQGQQAFTKFLDMASRFNCAVLVLRHLTKGSRDKAMYRGQGNIAFVGIARVVMLVGKHPEDPSIRVMARTKGNLTRCPPALTYEIQDAATKKERDKSKLIIGEFTELNAEDISSAAIKTDAKDELKEAVEFLERELEEGPRDVFKLEQMADKNSISKTALNRAVTKLKIVKESEGYGKNRRSTWSLPD